MHGKQAWKSKNLLHAAERIAFIGAPQVFFCGGCRYRVTAFRDWPVRKVKEALFAGGIARANKPDEIRNTPGIRNWDDLVRILLGIVGNVLVTPLHCVRFANLIMHLGADIDLCWSAHGRRQAAVGLPCASGMLSAVSAFRSTALAGHSLTCHMCRAVRR